MLSWPFSHHGYSKTSFFFWLPNTQTCPVSKQGLRQSRVRGEVEGWVGIDSQSSVWRLQHAAGWVRTVCAPGDYFTPSAPSFVLRQASGGPNSKTQNGLLSPPPEEKLTNSQTSLCEILQEKGRWAGVSLDQSALLPLRFKNIREKTDAHFVDVIKEDR